MHVYRRSNGCVRGAAGRKLLVVSSSNGSSILGTEQEHLNQGVAEEEEECDKVERDNGLLAGTVALAGFAEAALSAAPVLGREDEGGEPEVGEDEVDGGQVATVFANKGQDGTNEPEAQSNSGNDFLVNNVYAAVVILVEEPGYQAGDDG